MENMQQQSGLVVRDGFSGQETMQLAELSARAAAEQARAMVESRYVMALKKPRNIEMVRLAVLKECQRPAFAAVARYAKPIGGSKVEGWSIRFAEAALRALGNVLPEIATIYDDSAKRVVRVSVTDLEANLTYSKDITIEKHVERRNAKGRSVLAKRVNTSGDTVYIVEATEDELQTKEASLTSKVLRQLALRLLPGDILDEAFERISATLQAGDAKDPAAANRRLIDAFAELGVPPTELERYLGHPVAQIVSAEREELRTAYAGLKEGEATWSDIVELKLGERVPAPPTADAPSSAPASTAAQRLTQKLRPRAAATAPAPAPVVVETTATAVPTPAPAATRPTTTPTDAGGAPEPSTPPSVSADAGAPAAPAADALTPDGMLRLREDLTALQAELVAILGKPRAEAVWSGTDGVKTLRGVRTQAHAAERTEAARRLVKLAYLDEEIASAVKSLSAKVGAQMASSITTSLPALQQKPFQRDVDAAQGALDVLVGHLLDQPVDEDLPWGSSGQAEREPDEEG